MVDTTEIQANGVQHHDYYRQFGYLPPEVTGEKWASIDLCFRLATNGVIVNTKVNDEPVATTSAGLF